jgi:hypothetical protein
MAVLLLLLAPHRCRPGGRSRGGEHRRWRCYRIAAFDHRLQRGPAVGHGGRARVRPWPAGGRVGEDVATATGSPPTAAHGRAGPDRPVGGTRARQRELREELAHRAPPVRRPGTAAMPAELGIAAAARRLSGGRGSASRRPTVPPSRSTRRSGGPPASVPTWIHDMCSFMAGSTRGGPVSPQASHCRHGRGLGA